MAKRHLFVNVSYRDNVSDSLLGFPCVVNAGKDETKASIIERVSIRFIGRTGYNIQGDVYTATPEQIASVHNGLVEYLPLPIKRNEIA